MKVINWISDNKILVGLIIFGSILRLIKLEYQSPWADEIFTLVNTSTEKSFIEIFQNLKSDVHPPLYYYIIHCFNFILGDTIFTARFVSVVFGILGFFAIYKLAEELINKKVGVIAVALLAVNYFHLYYSQEARMYSMLFFTTTLSFYYLVKFIKNPTLKTAVMHSIFACLMIYSQFFALFTLFSQYVILLYFIIRPYKTSKLKFFQYSLLSGILTAILYIPAWVIFFTASKRESIWIQIPQMDVFTQMFKEFFGFAEIPIMIAFLAILFFLISLFKRKEIQKSYINPVDEKQTFSFFILFNWISITLFISLIISFINLPMIVSRYFINVLPAIIILVASGLFYIKNDLVKFTLISIFILFSFSDIVFVKSYYTKIVKVQYNEIAEIVKNRKDKKDPIYTNLSIWINYFFNKDLENNKLILKPSIDSFIGEMKNDPLLIHSFWYVNAEQGNFSISEDNKKFIDENFYLSENFEGFDAWAKHYVLKGSASGIGDINLIQPNSGENFPFNIESFDNSDQKVRVDGWAYFEGQDSKDSHIELALLKEGKFIMLKTNEVLREDVTSYFKSKYDLKKSGFSSYVDITHLEKGKYQLVIFLFNKKNVKQGLKLTDKIVVK
ncbi:glycosyltransferase family 39 protein [Flavobacterium sp.]